MDFNFKSLRDNPDELLHIMRLSRGASQKELSERSGYCANTILKWEHKPNYNIIALIDMAEALDYEIEINIIDTRK